jgi:hypothetical protein
MRLVCNLTWQQTSHNPEVAGSNPAPATGKAPETGPFSFAADSPPPKLLPNFCLVGASAQAIATLDAMEPFRIEHYANFGTEEPWVARLMLGLRELVYAVPAFGATRDDFVNELGEVFESLGMAFEELRGLRERLAEGAPALDVERSYSSFYGYLWKAYKDRFQVAMRTLGLDIGFLFQKDSLFEARAAELVGGQPELGDLIALMRRDRTDFQKALADYRNKYLEHRRGDPDPRLLGSFHRLDSAETAFENVWQAIEDYVALYVIANLPPFIEVVEVPEHERDPARPTRFKFVVLDLPEESGR